MIKCVLCGFVYQKSKIKCDACKVNLRALQKNESSGCTSKYSEKQTETRVHEKK